MADASPYETITIFISFICCSPVTWWPSATVPWSACCPGRYCQTCPLRQLWWKPPYNPRKAIIRSAIIPGWGRAYNKIPETSARLWCARYNKQPSSSVTSANIRMQRARVYPWPPMEPFERWTDQTTLLCSQRPTGTHKSVFLQTRFGKCRLLRALFPRIQGLNVADAAVDAHLKSFDVSDNSVCSSKPFYHPATGSTGLNLVFNLGQAKGNSTH